VHRLHRAARRDEAGGGDRLVTMRLFHLSLVYLTVVFAAVAAGALLR
jgi:heme O synthase-like polyprenyltransferase